MQTLIFKLMFSLSAAHRAAVSEEVDLLAQAEALQRELASCFDDSDCDPTEVIERYKDLSRQNDVDLLAECGKDLGCINDRLQHVANVSDFDYLIAERPDLYTQIEGSTPATSSQASVVFSPASCSLII